MSRSDTKPKRYEQMKDGEWFEVASLRNHLMACCDCGLVHRMNFKIIDGTRIQIQAFRAPNLTKKRRSK